MAKGITENFECTLSTPTERRRKLSQPKHKGEGNETATARSGPNNFIAMRHQLIAVAFSNSERATVHFRMKALDIEWHDDIWQFYAGSMSDFPLKTLLFGKSRFDYKYRKLSKCCLFPKMFPTPTAEFTRRTLAKLWGTRTKDTAVSKCW